MACDIYFSFAQPDAQSVLPVIEALKSRGLSVSAGASDIVDAKSISSRIVQELASRGCSWRGFRRTITNRVHVSGK